MYADRTDWPQAGRAGGLAAAIAAALLLATPALGHAQARKRVPARKATRSSAASSHRRAAPKSRRTTGAPARPVAARRRSPAAPTRSPRPGPLRFLVTAAQGLLPGPQNGRLFVLLNTESSPEPRLWPVEPGLGSPPVLARDLQSFASGVGGIVDRRAACFPIRSLADLEPDDYYVQAVFDWNRDLRLLNAPGNLYSPVRKLRLDPARSGTIRLELTRKMPAERLPAESEYVRFVKLRSNLLSRYHGRPVYLRAGIILPRDYAREPSRRYPLRVQIGGYGTRCTYVRDMMAPGSDFRDVWLRDDLPRMLLLHLDGAGPYGDPYQVNSANNGPYGDAVTKELIPYVEQKFRALGRPEARFLTGHSTGGWVSLALQVFYPDFFNGAWSFSPDPVDFRALQSINIYQDRNAYYNEDGAERPSARDIRGKTRYSVRLECQMENALGRGDGWTMSGGQWGAWNATFGPRGDGGRPAPLWDPQSGEINPAVARQWEEYDLRLVLERNWPELAPKLRGKIRIWVGEADDYFLNEAVHLLDQSLAAAQPPFAGQITFGAGKDHGWSPLTQRRLMLEMVEALRPLTAPPDSVPRGPPPGPQCWGR
jgi:S-formylglutathione hydrolase FrmB